MIIINQNIQVLTAPKWLFKMFDGVTNKQSTAQLKPTLDANENYILDKSVLMSSDFNFDIEIINPTNGQKTTPRKEMWEIPFAYFDPSNNNL